MSFLRNIFGKPPKSGQNKYFLFHVRCKRCGEILEGRVNITNDPSVEYENGQDIFHCRKVLMGDGKNFCFQQIEVNLIFDQNHDLLAKEVDFGGEFLEDGAKSGDSAASKNGSLLQA